MAPRGYLGKISAVVAINTGGVKPSLNATAKDIQSWGRTVQSRLSGTSDAAKRAFDGIFTPLQKLQAAVKAANRQPLDLKVPNVRSFLDLAKATEQIAKPLGNAQKQLTGLSQGVQSQLLPALVSAQKQASGLFDAIANGAKITERDFANTEARINRVVQAIGRANEASQATRGLATGQELRFQNPEFLRSTSRAAQLQQQAAQLSPEAISGRGIVSLIGQQRVAADEAERLRATIDRIAVTRRGDAQAAQQAYAQQLAGLERINNALEEQITLANRATAANQQAANQRGAFDVRELDRRSGATARRRGNAFEDATAGIFGAGGRQDERFIGPTVVSVDSLIGRIRELDQQYQQLPEAARAALGPQVNALNMIANAARSGSAGVGTLEDAYERARVQIEAAAAAAEQARTSFITIPGDPEGPFGPPRPSTPLGPNYLRDRAVSEASAGLGLDIAAPQRALENLRGSITSVKGQIDSLPAGLRAQFVPAIQGAEAEYRRLFSTVGVTAQEIQESATRLANLEQGISRAANAARQFGGTFAQFRDSIDARSAAAGLEFLRTALSRATGDATRAAGAVDRLAEAYQQAASTPGGFQQNAAGLQRLANEAIEATAAVDGVGQSQAALQRGFARTGDVARGSFGNAGLAIQQAAFAFEDFFSVTGGLDQRIRAAGNNISQLGFIIGGTTGLIVGISAAIGAQLVSALVRWYNEGRSTEDQTKALNDALARQKSLVEDLAQAFESLGDSIARRAFSAPAQEARQFAKELEDIAKKQREVRESRVADLDEGVQRERANQNRISRELESETDPGRRVALQRRLDASRAAEREAARAATSRRVSGDEVANQVANAVRSVQRSLLGGLTGPSRDQAEREIDAEAERVRRSIPTGGSPQDVLAQRDRIQGLIRDLTPLAEGTPGFFGRGSNVVASRELAGLQRTLLALELPLQKALDELSNSIIRASQAASLEIESAQTDVADAVRRGVPGAALLQQNLDAIADEMDAAQTRLRDAQKIEDPNEREQQIRIAQRDIDGIRAREDAIAEASRDIVLTSGRGGERTTSALSALQGNERFANEYGGLIARLQVAVAAENAARLQLQKSMKGGTDAEKEAARAAYESAAAVSDMAAAAAEAAMAMEQAVARIRKIGADALSQSERMADEAQQRLNERPTDENRQRRDAAERQLIDDRERVGRANRDLDRRRTELQKSDPLLVLVNSELESINQERKRLADEAKKNNTTVDPAEEQRLAEREAKLLAERERRLFDLTEAERRQQDAINREINARRRLVDFMEEVERRQNPQGDPVRGLDLMETPGERSARELAQKFADLNAAFEAQIDALVEAGNGVVDQDFLNQANDARKRRDEAASRALRDDARAAAPGLFALADSVQNAILQGPSRAALVGTDVSTSEGQRELYRLMRGDDASKDENLVELRKQSESLAELVRRAEEAARQAGIVLDLN